MSSTAEPRRSQSDLDRSHAATRDLVPGLVLLLVTQGSLIALDPDAASSGWSRAWSLSPLLAIGLLAWAQVRILGRSDERERLEQLTAMSVGFGVCAVLLAAAGVAHAADLGDPAQLMQLTFICGVVAWIGALAVAQRANP